MKTIAMALIASLATTAAYAQTDKTAQKPSTLVECKNLYPEKILNHGFINPDYYTYDYTNAKNQCIAKVPITKPEKKPVNQPYILMKNGSPIKVSKDGTMDLLNKNVTLNNGEIVTAKGEIIKTDGSKKMLLEGEYIDMSGKLVLDK